jgi:hypothetical protein
MSDMIGGERYDWRVAGRAGDLSPVVLFSTDHRGQLPTFMAVSSMILISYHLRRDIVSVRLEVATIALVMFSCTPQECKKNGPSLL